MSSHCVHKASRKVCRFLALEDAIHIAGRAPMRVDRVWSVGDQTADVDEEALKVDGWKSVLGRKRNDLIAMNDRYGGRRHD
jgi:hypothetical protein